MLNIPVMRAAFIWAYNKQGGFINLNPGWESNNCCFKFDSSSNVLHFGGLTTTHIVLPCTTASAAQCNGAYNDPIMRFRTGSISCQAPTMAPNFFSQFPPMAAANCSNAQNPGLFIKKY